MDRPITVLESVAMAKERTNPYIPLLVGSLPDNVRPLWFTWRRALIEPFDVLHVHWPEVKLRGAGTVQSWARWALFFALLVRVRVGRKALVRTLHNVTPHESLSRIPRVLLRLCDRWTTSWILLTELTSPPRPGPSRLVPHGHYRPWFDELPRARPVAGRLLHAGLIRRYKGCEPLLRSFSSLADAALTLRVVGATVDDDVAATIRAAAAADPRISFTNEWVSDEVLVSEITSSQLVVLPFTKLTNSGSLLLALSLDRPVMVPAGPMADALSAEVGDGWVITYQDPLEPEALEGALAVASGAEARPRPNLALREWDAIGEAHAAVFSEALAVVRSTHPDDCDRRAGGGRGLRSRVRRRPT